MPKSDNKTTPKKTTRSKSTAVDPAKKLDQNLESYVPKITHWTKSKKTREEVLPVEDVVQTNLKNNSKNIKSTKTSLIDTQNTSVDTAQQNENKTSKLDKLADFKQLDSPSQLVDETKSTEIQTLDTKPKPTLSIPAPKSVLPSFLNRKSKDSQLASDTQQTPNNQLKPLKDKTLSSNNPNIPQNNSLTSIFKRDQDEISNIKRVFRKSIMFLIISLLSFGLSSLASSSFVYQSILVLAFTGFGFIALTNIFFIIVAHRSYIWLFLIGQFLILSITQYPYSTNISTLLIGLVTVLLTYLAYLDLEKVQLGSRLFSIPYIVGESTKILSSVLIFIVCLSSYNQIDAKGLDRFMGESVLAIPIVMDRAVLPLYQNVLVKGSGLDISDKNNTTVKTLLCADKKLVCDAKNNSVLPKEEYAKLSKQCDDTLLSENDCKTLKDNAEQAVLNNILSQELPNSGLTLSTRLDSKNYQPVLNKLVQNKIKRFVDPSKFSFLPSYIPINSLIPLIVSLVLFILLSIFKFILVWFGYIITWILWKLLQITGFVRLDIEMVEAEIVGI